MLKDELQQLIEGDVLNDNTTLTKYSTDASIFEVCPEAVVFPKTSDDVKKLVRFTSEKKQQGENVSLTARAAGTDMSGGPLNESIIVDFSKYFTRIKNVEKTENGGYAIVEPGVYYRDFEKETLKQGLLMPSYPASRELCMVGGIAANNSGGEKTLFYGKTERYVEKLKVVLADGEEYLVESLSKEKLEEKKNQKNFEGQIYRDLYALLETNKEKIRGAKPNVSKNSAGYFLWNVWDGTTFDLTKLFVGSQGTLGLITEITFKLVQKKKYDRVAAIFLQDTKILGELIKAVLEHKPENLESYDDHTLKLAIKFLPDLIKVLHPKHILGLALQFIPEALMMIKSGHLPKLVLLALFAGDDKEEVDKRVLEFGESMKRFPVQIRITKSDEEEQKYWTIRRESFNLLRHHLSGKHTAPFIDDFVVRPEFLPQFLPELNAILAKYDLTYTIAGHMGDGNFHIIPLMDFKKPETKNIIKALGEEVYDLVIKYKGSITGEHNDGLIRTPYLEKMYGREVIRLFEETKKILDPLNIFNPGKKVGGDLFYAMNHIKSS